MNMTSYLFIYSLYKIVLEVQQRKLRTIKKDSTKHIGLWHLYSSVLTLTNFRHHERYSKIIIPDTGTKNLRQKLSSRPVNILNLNMTMQKLVTVKTNIATNEIIELPVVTYNGGLDPLVAMTSILF